MVIMKRFPHLSTDDLGRWLNENYGLAPIEIRPVDTPGNIWTYHITAAGNHAVELKLSEPGSMNETLPDLLAALYYDFGVRQMPPPPLRARTGTYINVVDSYEAMLLPYLPAHRLDERDFDNKRQRHLGALLARIHACKLHDDELPPQERFDADLPTEALKRILYEIDHPSEGYSQIQSRLVRLMRAQRENIEKAVHTFNITRLTVVSNDSLSDDFVLAHGAVTPANIRLSSEDEILLVNWDAPLLAPRERDLYRMIHLPGVLEGYRSYTEGYELNTDALEYYLQLHLLTDVLVYAARILFGRRSEEQNARYLAGLRQKLQRALA